MMNSTATRTRVATAITTLFLAASVATARADDDTALIVDATLIEPLAENGRVATSVGNGAEIRILPNREAITGSIGGYFALGKADGAKTMRDIYDFHVNIGYKRERSRGKGFIPFLSLGLDVLHMTTREVDGPTHRGITLGVNAQLGIMGFVSQRWIYRVSGSYLGAIVPGTGDDLGGLVLQAGLGRTIGD